MPSVTVVSLNGRKVCEDVWVEPTAMLASLAAHVAQKLGGHGVLLKDAVTLSLAATAETCGICDGDVITVLKQCFEEVEEARAALQIMKMPDWEKCLEELLQTFVMKHGLKLWKVRPLNAQGDDIDDELDKEALDSEEDLWPLKFEFVKQNIEDIKRNMSIKSRGGGAQTKCTYCRQVLDHAQVGSHWRRCTELEAAAREEGRKWPWERTGAWPWQSGLPMSSGLVHVDYAVEVEASVKYSRFKIRGKGTYTSSFRSPLFGTSGFNIVTLDETLAIVEATSFDFSCEASYSEDFSGGFIALISTAGPIPYYRIPGTPLAEFGVNLMFGDSIAGLSEKVFHYRIIKYRERLSHALQSIGGSGNYSSHERTHRTYYSSLALHFAAIGVKGGSAIECFSSSGEAFAVCTDSQLKSMQQPRLVEAEPVACGKELGVFWSRWLEEWIIKPEWGTESGVCFAAGMADENCSFHSAAPVSGDAGWSYIWQEGEAEGSKLAMQTGASPQAGLMLGGKRCNIIEFEPASLEEGEVFLKIFVCRMTEEEHSSEGVVVCSSATQVVAGFYDELEGHSVENCKTAVSDFAKFLHSIGL